MHFDHEFWKQWEGQRIDAKFLLERLTHSDGTRAAFETLFRERAATILFFVGDIAAHRKRWRESAGLSHPALVEIFERGETAVGETRCAYIVTERADDNLGEVLRDRALTPEEAREMLVPLLGVMRYLHERGFTHGELRPENLMAFDDQLKVSSDSLSPGGDTAADCAAIGELVKQVLGGSLPLPFGKIVEQSSVAAMEACLRGESDAKQGSRWKLWAGGAVAVLAGFAFWPTTTPPSAPTPAPVAVEPAPIVKPSPTTARPEQAPDAAPPKPPPTTARPEQAPNPAPSKPTPAKVEPVRNLDGISQVLPEIPQPARNTITGRVRVNIRVNVNGEGRVTEATLESRGVSSYFSSRVLAAARGWQFPAGQAPSEWLLRFELMRVETRVSVAKAR